MVSKSKTPDEVDSKTNSREAILEAAKHVFCRKGYEGATVKEICDEAGLNVSLVSYHFGGKAELYRECLGQFGRERILRSAERVLRNASSLDEFRIKLKLFAEEFLESHLAEPEISKILCREFDGLKDQHKSLFKEVFLKIFEKISAFFEGGKDQNYLRSDMDNFVAGLSFFGALIHAIRVDSVAREFFGMSLQKENYRERLVSQMVDQLVLGLRAK